MTAAEAIVAWDPDSETRAAISAAIAAAKAGDASAKELIVERFSTRLEFGTAGLRGPMGFGTSRMNDVTVIQSTQVRVAAPSCESCTRQIGRAGPVEVSPIGLGGGE
jgi:hypothetical protein